MESPRPAVERYDENQTEENNIRKLVEQTCVFGPEEQGVTVLQFFKDHSTAEGVVIVDDEKPVGLVMRNDFYQKLGSLYGREIFMRRPIQLIMNTDPLIVDVAVDIPSISIIAMNRDQQVLYDLVIITEDENYIGVVSIKRFMIELSRQRERQIELLEKQKEMLHAANEAEIRHRKQIEGANNALREKNESIKNLFDNAGQGFLSFGSDMIISEEHSLECVQMFRGPIGGKHFIELIGWHMPQETAETITSVMKCVFSSLKALQQKVYLSLLPEDVSIYKKIVKMEYKIIQHQGQKRMMLVLTDITEKKNLEMKTAEERLNLKMVVKALSRQSDVNAGIAEFRNFTAKEAAGIVTAAESPRAALGEIFRRMHTFKGDFAQLGLHRTSAKLHEIEDGLASLSEKEEGCSFEQLEGLVGQWDARAILRDDLSVLSETLGQSFFDKEESFRIGKDKLLEIERRIGLALAGRERNEVISFIRSLRLHNFKDLLRPYDDYLLALAERLEKSLEPMEITGDDIFIDKEGYGRFVKSLTHLFRNMIDHGIETVEERVAAEKSELGKVRCNISRQEEQELRLEISDDGRGIELDKVRSRAVEKGILSSEKASAVSPERLYDLLFLDSFSTRESVTVLSGRGVGLSAVKAETQRLGGKILVDSKPGYGTRFTFILPIIGDPLPRREDAALCS
jgi:two-component system chemotaxis sensor kinase CheA